MELDLDQRKQWPLELLELLQLHPRETWPSKTSYMSQFWLDKHDSFRTQIEELKFITVDYREQVTVSGEFITQTAPRLQTFLSHLQGHHQIEDSHYFPAFRAAEKKLAAGFDVLAKDHELIHHGINEVIDSFNTFFEAVKVNGNGNLDALKKAGEYYIEISELLFRRLLKHLADEEDLIIPLMLQRGQ